MIRNRLQGLRPTDLRAGASMFGVDAELRELQRTFRRSGTAEAEAAWLRARLRVGGLDQNMLALAGYCGHKAANMVLGVENTGDPPDPLHFTFGLRDYGESACQRAAWAIAEAHLNYLGESAAADSSRAHQWKLGRHQLTLAACLKELASALVGAGGGSTFWGGMSAAGLSMHVMRDACGRVTTMAPEPLVEAVCSVLIPWALRYDDPVQARVEAIGRD